jgi:hypothetical protein
MHAAGVTRSRRDTQPLMVVKCGMQNRRTDPPCISRCYTLLVAVCAARRRVRSARVHARRHVALERVLEVSPSPFLVHPFGAISLAAIAPLRARRPRRTAVQVRAALCAGRVAAHRPRRRKRRLASTPAVVDVLAPPPPPPPARAPRTPQPGAAWPCAAAAAHRARSPHKPAACAPHAACAVRFDAATPTAVVPRRTFVLCSAGACRRPLRAALRLPRLLPGGGHTNARAGACAARRLAPPRGVD